MKITDVRAVQPAAVGVPNDWRTVLGQILVAVDTDRGLTGYGVGGGGAAGVLLVVKLLRDALLGRDPTEVEKLSGELYRQMVPFGRKGLSIMALSGVDLALWDLRGKMAGLPIARLLADKPHGRVPCYASMGADPAKIVEQGFGAIKLFLPPVPDRAARDRVAALVADARRVVGPKTRLMTEAFMLWDLPTALDLAQEFHQHHVEWLEEPLLPDDFTGYAQLMQHSPTPIAGGEHEYMAAGFQELVDRKLHAVLQPDATWCGGLTELVKIYKLAAKAGVRVCQHRGSEVWGLHAVAAFEHDDPLAEAGRPWMTWVQDAPQIERGTIAIPDRPGFGIRIDEAKLP